MGWMEKIPVLARTFLSMGRTRAYAGRLCDTFGFDAKRKFAPRREFISPPLRECTQRCSRLLAKRLALFLRAGFARLRLNHIGFKFNDSEGAIQVIESRGVRVDLTGDAMVHGPEDVWYK